MLSKEQANIAADTILAANKSAQRPKPQRFQYSRYRAIGGLIGFSVGFGFFYFVTNFSAIILLLSILGATLGEWFGKRQSNKTK